jgi:hypothetical protein
LTGVIGNTISVGKYVAPTENMHTQTIDNQLIANSILGGTIGNRQDAKVGFDFSAFNLVKAEQELELAA